MPWGEIITMGWWLMIAAILLAIYEYEHNGDSKKPRPPQRESGTKDSAEASSQEK